MFGSRKNKDQSDAQIPYEVYETVQQPAAQRRRWIIRLIAALIVITLLIFGFMALSRWLLGDDNKDKSGGSQGSSQSGGDNKPSNNDLKPPDNLQQAPGKYTAPQGNGAKPDTVIQGDQTVKSTVNKPE
jgi:hypothetical protein